MQKCLDLKRNKWKHVVLTPALQSFQVEFFYKKGGRNWSELKFNTWEYWAFGKYRMITTILIGRKGEENFWSEWNLTWRETSWG